MRLSSLLRKGILSNLPARAGIPPTWDRPDPPDSIRTTLNRRVFYIYNKDDTIITTWQLYELFIANFYDGKSISWIR